MRKLNVRDVKNGLCLSAFNQKSFNFVISDKWVDEVSHGDEQAVKMIDVKRLFKQS